VGQKHREIVRKRGDGGRGLDLSIQILKDSFVNLRPFDFSLGLLLTAFTGKGRTLS
jgi:hypothetical protein